MIDLRRLQILRAVHHHGTVSAAARSLHLTPSAVSQQIRQLARELGVDLLQPDGRRVRLTGAAQVLLTHADTLEAQWEQARADLAAQQGGATGPLRLYGYPTAVASFLAPATARLGTTHPDLDVTVTEAEADVGFGRLLSGEADVTVVIAGAACPPPDDPRFEQRSLVDEPLDLLVPAGHPLAGRELVTLEETAREPWIVAEEGTCDHYHVVVAACIAAGFTPRVVHHAKEWLAIVALVSSGLGVSLIPRMLPLHTEHQVTRLRLTGAVRPTRRILTFVRRGGGEHPAVRHGLTALREAATAGLGEVRAAA